MALEPQLALLLLLLFAMLCDRRVGETVSQSARGEVMVAGKEVKVAEVDSDCGGLP